VDVTKNLKMRRLSSWVLGAIWNVFMSHRERSSSQGRTCDHRAGTGVRLPDQGNQESPGGGRRRKESPLEPSEGVRT
jgi:hypothetical protein